MFSTHVKLKMSKPNSFDVLASRDPDELRNQLRESKQRSSRGVTPIDFQPKGHPKEFALVEVGRKSLN